MKCHQLSLSYIEEGNKTVGIILSNYYSLLLKLLNIYFLSWIVVYFICKVACYFIHVEGGGGTRADDNLNDLFN